MKKTAYKTLTSAENEDEHEIEERRIAFLDATLDSLSETKKEELLTRMQIAVNEALVELLKKVSREGSIVDPTSAPLQIRLYLMTSEESRIYEWGKGRITSGQANVEDSIICLIKHLALAPKEVIKQVAIHEALHLLYPRAEKAKQELAIRNSIKQGYPSELQQEEEWVRVMEEKFCGKDAFLEAWEIAVERGGMNWRNQYYRLKKTKFWRRFDDYASPDLT